MGLSEGQVGTFFAPYVTGGIFGVYASGTPAAAASTLEAAVAELKAIATGSTATVDSNKAKVTLERMAALEGEAVTEMLLAASLRSVSVASLADRRSESAATVSAAAATALKAVPSYAVLGTTFGTPSYAAIIKMVNK